LGATWKTKRPKEDQDMKNFLTWLNEFAGDEPSPEFSELFAEIAGELSYRRKVSMTERDLWLTDFSKAWSGPKDHTGQLLSGRVPDDWAAEWYRINGLESNYPSRKQEDYSATIGDAIFLHATESGVLLQLGANTIHVDPDDLQPLIDALTACKKVVGSMAPNPPIAVQQNSAFMHSQNYKAMFGDDRPGVQAARKANDQRMQFALENERREHMDSAFNRLASLAQQARRY
jgi:hypothetical protein